MIVVLFIVIRIELVFLDNKSVILHPENNRQI